MIFAPAWLIAPENTWLEGVEDIFATVQWLQKNAKQFNIDPARIVIAGQSAGGTLAAGVTQLARELNLHPSMAAQILRYPSLNDTTVLEPNSTQREFLSWAEVKSETAWTARMGGIPRAKRDNINTPPYAAPGRAESLRHLPPAIISVGDYDLYRDECKLYANRLQEAGVEANYPESPHGFDGMPGSVQGQIMWEREAEFVKRF